MAQRREDQTGAPDGWAAALAEAQHRFQAVAQVSLQAQLIHRRFKPLWLNAAFADLFGFETSGEALGAETLIDLFDEPTRAEPDAAWARIAEGVAVFGRRTLYKRDGSGIRAEIYARRVMWDGACAAALCVLDVSEEERAIQELAEARAEAEHAARSRRQLLAIAADELRPSLAAAMDVLARAPQTAPSGAFDACERLQRGIEAAIAAGAHDCEALSPARTPFNPAAVAREAADSMCASEGAARIELSHASADGAKLMGDPACVRAFIRALLAAALRRADDLVQCDIDASAAGLAVRVRAASAIRRAPVGLDSLRAVRPLAAALGGVVAARQDESGAWTASFFAPMPAAPIARETDAAESRDVLVIDDHQGARRLLEAVLHALGHRPVLAADGANAIAAFAARRFDLVILDLNLPGMDGLEIARRLRALPVAWANAPIAALTASLGESVKDAVAEAGMDAFLRKPVSVSRLSEAIAALTRGRSVEPAEIKKIDEAYHEDESADEIDRDHEPPALSMLA